MRVRVAAWLLLGLVVLLAGTAARAEETERFPPFGKVILYRTSLHPSHVVLFVSGDGGWNQGVVDMARALSSLDALVVGIDVRSYLAALRRSDGACLYPAADFEALSQALQKKLGLPSYQLPVLVGYSSGASLVYATLAQAPPNTFRGGISLGFCPELDVARPLCRGSGLLSKPKPKGRGLLLNPVPEVASPWIAFQGILDQACSPTAAQAFVGRVKGAEIVMLPKVGHGFSVQKNWMPQLRAAFTRLVAGSAPAAGAAPARGPALADLPLVEVPANGAASDELAFVASGDGGWAGLDREVAGVLAERGVPVVGLDTLQYYWQPRGPDESARALERILRHYLAAWHKTRILLIGYSRGADVLPFMASRLPDDLAQRVVLIALLGPEPRISFAFHYTDWLTDTPRGNTLPVLPEVEKLRGKRLLCVYGANESDSLCPELPAGLAHLDPRPGGHHFGGDYRAVAERILREAASSSREGAPE